jgi:PAS domain S-box-containing protein
MFFLNNLLVILFLALLLAYLIFCITISLFLDTKIKLNNILKPFSLLKNTKNEINTLKAETVLLLERYQVLTENLAAAIIIRKKDGQIAYCSPYTEVLTGYPVDKFYNEDLPNKANDNFLDIIHEESREKYLKALKLANLGEAFQFRYRFIHRTGIDMWAETRIVPILDEYGDLTSTLSVTIDVTGPVQHQKEIENQNRDLEDFSYMLSHDLKAPVFTIKGMLNLIDEDFKGEANKLEEPLSYIHSAAARIETLVKGVLDYSKIKKESNVEENINLNEIFENIKDDFHSQISESNAKIEIENNLPKVYADKLKIYQIFSNLFGNALKYRDNKKALEIKIKSEKINNPRMIAISVKDNGMGIPEDKLEAIFRPFQRINNEEIEGTGIGLACVQKLLDKVGGEISVTSKEDVGSIFKVLLRKTNQ